MLEFVRNGNFNPRNFLAGEQDTLKRNQLGFAVGTPICKDKLSVFGLYQRMFLREVVGGRVAFIPTAAQRAVDFSSLSATIWHRGGPGQRDRPSLYQQGAGFIQPATPREKRRSVNTLWRCKAYWYETVP